jgi:hypothetical protein
MRRKWDREAVDELLKRREKWKGKAKDFFEQEGMPASQFYSLKKSREKLQLALPANKGDSPFFPLTLKRSTEQSLENRIKLTFPNGFKLELPAKTLTDKSMFASLQELLRLSS